MGLVIQAVRQAVRNPAGQPGDPRLITITPDEVREYPTHADEIQPGYYRVQAQHWFTAAPGYDGTYHTLIQVLADIGIGSTPEAIEADPAAFTGAPFVELITFSDHQGIIGPVTSRKLAADFAAHAPWVPDEWRALYGQFHTAFTLAADAGFVQFC